MKAESKVQKVARGMSKTRQVVRLGTCGHELTRVRFAPQTGQATMRWWCADCGEEQQ